MKKGSRKIIVNVSQFEYEQLKINAAERTLSVPVFLKLEALNCGTGTKRAFGRRKYYDKDFLIKQKIMLSNFNIRN